MIWIRSNSSLRFRIYRFGFIGLSFLVGICALAILISFVAPTITRAESEQPGNGLPNIIYIVVDTLRSDHVNAYGYERPTTTNLTTLLAEQGVIFLDATTTSPWTCPANATMITGRNPTNIGASWTTMHNSVPAQESTIAEYLQMAGYHTAGFISSVWCVKGSLGFDQGFDLYDDQFADRTSSNKARAEEVNAQVFDWLEQVWTPTISGTQPLFLYLYYFDPHTWYDPLPPYDELYDPSYSGSLTPEKFADGIDAINGDLILSEDDLYHLLALYDGEITYWDYHLGQLLNRLDSIDLLDNTLIIVTSDHGEMMGEHGKWSHAGSIYEEVLRVPLIAWYPGVISSGMKITTPVQTMAIMPTILDYVGQTVPDNLDSSSLKPLIESKPYQGPSAVFGQVDQLQDQNHPLFAFAPRSHLRSIREDGWKLIQAPGSDLNDELYEIEPVSIYEIHNLASVETSRLKELEQKLYGHFFSERQYIPFSQR